MKKIAILTLAPTDNYGGILQALALFHSLKNLGHEVTLLYKPHVDPPLKNIARKILEIIPFHNIYNLKTKKREKPIREKRILKHRSFFEEEMILSPDLSTYDQLEKYCSYHNFDAIVVGSDQVWRRSYINDRYYLAYFLNFIKNDSIKKYSYAASFGINFWESDKDVDKITDLLTQFTAISVREASGVDICKKTFSQENVQHVLDPTLLLDKEYYIHHFIEKYITTNALKNIPLSTYLLDPSEQKNHIVKEIAQHQKVDLYAVKNLKTDHTLEEFISVPEWLNTFNNSNFIITDSFHGMVFSIIFEKNFIVLANKERGLDRFTSLLNLLGLQNRLIDPNEKNLSILEATITKNIDYQEINTKLAPLKKEAFVFLKKI